MASSSRSTSSKSTTPAAKSPHPTYPPPGNNASILLEKTRPGVRRSTPDSEALASSEDEEHHHGQTPAAPVVKPTRRTSWLNDPNPLARKASLPTSSSFSSAPSNSTTSAADQTTWGGATSPGLNAPLNWGSAGTGSFAWSSIWNQEARKDPPSRLTEVLQSPTSSIMPSASTANSGDDILSPLARTISGDSNIPFSIPLQPTLKTYRSQSYSVGQLDTDQQEALSPNNGAAGAPATRRGTAAPLSSIQRRSSRPSLLGDLGHDTATLGRVREDEGDDNTEGADGGYNWSSMNQARRIEQLSLENALLRQAASGQLDNSRFRDRAMSSTSATSGFSIAQSHNPHRLPGSVPEEGDLAVEDLDELGGIAPGYNNARSNGWRRLSEHSTNLEKQFPAFSSLENRTLENVKKAHWQTSLGFGSAPEGPQSRRHSFADIPMRHRSIGSPADSHPPAIGSAASMGNRDDNFANFANGVSVSPADSSPSYFTGHDKPVRVSDNIPASGISTSLHQAYVMPNAFGRQHSNLGHAHQNQQLFIVTFKCGRADVFYIQEDTGLQVKTGDLVIVEADRGTDLGTVAHANVTWARARELKEHYAEEHYKWLMIFSRQSQSGLPNAVNPNSTSSNLNGAPGSAVGGMGPQTQHGMQESQGGDIKPKLIKRLAQSHEIQTLRDKEGSEAKAKRVCQQKVAEHRLNMEILDAEFQMDWKKLTFYYFADTYINFNSLVTDLFKIYKTRIWMSAINPASFVTPTAGLQPPSSLGFTQEGHPDRRRPHDFKPFVPSAGQGVVASAGGFSDAAARDITGSFRSQYMDPYQAFASGRQHDPGMSGFSQGVQPQTDPFASFQPSSYGTGEPNLSDLHNAAGLGPAGRQAHPTHGEWANRFQGLSLGS